MTAFSFHIFKFYFSAVFKNCFCSNFLSISLVAFVIDKPINQYFFRHNNLTLQSVPTEYKLALFALRQLQKKQAIPSPEWLVLIKG